MDISLFVLCLSPPICVYFFIKCIPLYSRTYKLTVYKIKKCIQKKLLKKYKIKKKIIKEKKNET